MKKAILSFSLLFFFSVSFGQSAKKLVKSGMDKYYDADFKGAIDDFTKAIALDSNFVDAYSSRGYAKNKLEDYKGAIADFSKSILLDPKILDNYLMRAKIRHTILDYKEAINDYTKGIELYPDYYSFYLSRAQVKYDSTDYKGAIADYTKSIELNSYYRNHVRLGEIDPLQTNNSKGLDYADAYYFRGLSKKNIKDHRGAIYDFTHVLEINLRVFYMETDFESTELYEKTGYQLNKSATAKLIEKSWPNLVDAIYQRGVSNYELKFYEEAAADFTNVINLSQNYAYAYLYRGISNFTLKNYYSTVSNCHDDFTKAIQLNPDLTEAYFYRGLLYNEGHSRISQTAYEDFSKALELNPKHAEAYYNRGKYMFKYRTRPDRESFTIDEIVDNYNKAIALKSFFPDAYYHSGIAKSHFDKKDYTGAIADYTKAIDQNPNFIDAYEKRSHTYYRISKNAEACSDVRKAIDLGGTYLHDLLKAYCK
jgi:tetratricopeptide (TPR) repeat protein